MKRAISNDAGRVKSFFTFFLFLITELAPHFSAHARSVSFPVFSPHLWHPNLLSPFPFINSVLPTKHLFGHDSTMMSYSNSLFFKGGG
jgi:hypothetical protein